MNAKIFNYFTSETDIEINQDYLINREYQLINKTLKQKIVEQIKKHHIQITINHNNTKEEQEITINKLNSRPIQILQPEETHFIKTRTEKIEELEQLWEQTN